MLRLLAPKEEFTFKRNSIWQIVPNNYLAIKPKNGGSLKKHISDESRWIYLDFKFVELDFTALSITLRILNLDATKVKSLNWKNPFNLCSEFQTSFLMSINFLF